MAHIILPDGTKVGDKGTEELIAENLNLTGMVQHLQMAINSYINLVTLLLEERESEEFSVKESEMKRIIDEKKGIRVAYDENSKTTTFTLVTVEDGEDLNEEKPAE